MSGKDTANTRKAGKPEAKPEVARGTWQDRLSDIGLNLFVGALRLLPVRQRLNLASWIVRRAVAPALGYYDRVEANIDHVWPRTPPAEKRRIADAAIDNLARAFIENYDPAEMLQRGAAYPVGGPGLAAFEQARAEGRPVLLLSGHYGNPICARCALVARGYEVGGLLRAMSNPYSNARYIQNYRDVAEPVFVQGPGGLKALLRHVRGGGVLAMVFDVFDGSGVPIDFLGQPAPTVTSPADIALKTGALLIPYFGIRRADRYGFDTILEEPIEHGDPVEMMREATRRLEARIKDDPGQWMWTHRRWKPKRQMKRQRKRAAATM
ncbi:KDO2-lipid IV(A) lauroyltransferase [Mameliella alba]|uniref:lysophospholipid acyltransferase family protein n=1 Tax=Mameliella alba TaxID=561184 RepID=UPI000883A455|nr:lysophospholipid acyltransferase family protein [Mameliella alba]OWV49761.1 lauroyl acyltransferase [Mameliella alba]PTR41756.1 KDO2-lipid IV(A) lauroyltransferase [Mameliella alba]GGF54237.1 lipid A biosynthesis lauroyl acyltransferase [Mameliella alba]SDC31759.1 KDO2-lipid IV(A) lauroyltransferase [Mameliella alba]